MFRFHILKCSEFSVTLLALGRVFICSGFKLRKCENVQCGNDSLQSQKVTGDSDKRLIFPEM